uniref:ATP synthase F0 subunit 8 n=1 Tax=Ptychadena wadei TaxID=1342839 RepID=UPI00286B30AE|nr:ATP synthase F0 subunit 8 [Ptychadena wadei]WKT09043.1 ATP synthase F0 subunit 8 [Ptychadena wadei]
MPQLCPDPWLFIFLTSWTILLTLAPNKILSHVYPNNFNSKILKEKYLSWPWLW